MDCEHAISLLSARLDHEIQPYDNTHLTAHLAECPACRATAEAFDLQHQDLRRAFAPRRAAAALVAEQVNGQLAAAPRPGSPRFPHTAVRIALLVGGVAAAILLLLTWLHRPHDPRPVAGNFPKPIPPGLFPQLERLTPRPRLADPAIAKLEQGAKVETKAGERRRVGLSEGSILYVNQNTQLPLVAYGSGQLGVTAGNPGIQLGRGEVFVEVTPRAEEPGKGFVLGTPFQHVKSYGGKFGMRSVGPDDYDIFVTQGNVTVTAMSQLGGIGSVDYQLKAGQKLTAKGIEPAPRASHLLDWTRDLMAAAESPLVPASAHEGGSLIAVDGNGQEAKLSLTNFTVDVHIEDGFARTTIDQTYFNHHPWRLEGTFYFPLPPDASLSRLAMYVSHGEWSALMEGGMAERSHARATYERIVANQRDPALLEWVDGSTFKMRVFPLEGRQSKRILLSYTQRLSSLYGRAHYRFPAGHSLQTVNEWNFRALVKNGKDLTATSPTHPNLKVEKQGDDLVLTDSAKSARVDRDVALDLTAVAGTVPDKAVRFVRAELDGQQYLALRYRPDLPGKTERQRRDWVFLYESSADRDPLLARTQIEVIRHLLSNVEHDDTFAILCAGTRIHRFAETSLPVTPQNIAAALQFLEHTHLIGALDLGRSLREASDYLKYAANPHLVHVGSGMTAIGTPKAKLAELLPKGVRYVGIGVGKRWNRAWMKELAEKTGGYFTQINPDETIAWRAFDLLATLNTPRLLNVAACGLADSSPFLTDATTLAQGEELFAVTRLAAGAALPHEVTVSGTFDGLPFRATFPVENVANGANYLPRTWAKWELDRLLLDYQHEPSERKKDEIVALSKAMYVMTPFTSLLVLENDAMYEEFKVDRGRKDHWALYQTPPRMRTFYDPLPNEVDVRNAPQGLKPKPNQVGPTVLVRGGRPTILGHALTGDQIRLQSLAEDADSITRVDPESVRVLRLDPAIIGAGIESDLLAERTIRVLREKTFSGSTAGAGANLQFGFILGLDRGVHSGKPGIPVEQLQQIVNMQAREPLSQARIDSYKRNFADYEGMTGRNVRVERAVEWVPTFDPITGMPLSTQKENQLGYYPPALSLMVKGSSRIHSRGDMNKLLNTSEDYRQIEFGTLSATTTAIDQPVVFAGDYATGLGVGRRQPTSSLTYARPSFGADARLFTDLVSYAPGLNSSRADLLAVLDAEAAPDLRETPGSIDDGARQLIDRARTHGWQTLVLPDVRFTFDGAGRYAYERRVSFGLRESVVCDGKTTLHLYPELGLGARRTVSRFHRAELTAIVPWALPPAADLARGCDLTMVDERTVALVPNTPRLRGGLAQYLQQRLVFAADGRLSERQIVRMPEKKILLREFYDGKGGVRILDADGKELASSSRVLESASVAPDLAPATDGLVVLPLPYRSRSQTFPAANLDPSLNLADEGNACYRYVDSDNVLSLLATAVGQGRGDEARLLVRTHFFDKGDLRPGLFAILAASRVDLHGESYLQNLAAQKPDSPLVRYLVLGASGGYDALLRFAAVRLGESVAPKDTFLGRLAVARDLVTRWQQAPPPWVGRPFRRTDMDRTLAFVHDNRDSVLGWALLLHMEEQGRFAAADWLRLAKAWEELAVSTQRQQVPPDYRAQYEQAWCLFRADKKDEARKLFAELYDRAVKAGGLPVIDGRFTTTMIGDAGADDQWTPLVRKTAAAFIKEKKRTAVIHLAQQCRKLHDPTLADTLVAAALDGIVDNDERLIVHLTAIDFLSRIDQTERAGELMDGLMKNDNWSKEPSLLRLGARVASQRGLGNESADYLEGALDLEYRSLPEVIDLQRWREDYGTLLSHYLDQAKRSPASALAAKTIRAVDRWRAHDPEATGACETAAKILRLVGEEEVAWEYLMTPYAMQAEKAASVYSTAKSLSREGDFTMAEFAYEVAAEADPQSAEVLWDRAQNLRRAGRNDEADRWLRVLAAPQKDETWEWRRIRERAEWELKRR